MAVRPTYEACVSGMRLRVANMDVVEFPPSAFDPMGGTRFAVKCPDHGGEYIQFSISFLEAQRDEKTFEQHAREAIIKDCAQCVALNSLPPTRWPEGAEL